MIAEVVGPLDKFSGPIRIVVGENDQVERPAIVRAIFGDVLPAAEVTMAADAEHLLPMEAPFRHRQSLPFALKLHVIASLNGDASYLGRHMR